MGYPVVHFEVIGKDADKLQSFYSDVIPTMGPREVMEGLVVGLFTDPEGHVIGVLEDAS